MENEKTPMKKHISLCLTGIIALLAAGVGAQTHESITVQVIDVPVYVFSHGKPISNLTRDNFELFVNGKRQKIDYFDTIELATPLATSAAKAAPAATPIADPRARRLFLLVFDLAYGRPAALARAQKAAAIMVDHALPQDFFAVATYGSTGANFVIPFTRDHDVIRRALLKLAPSSAHDALALSITNAERDTAEAWDPSFNGGGGGAGGEDPMAEIMAGFKTEERQRAKTAAKDQLADLGSLAARLKDLEGYKHVILFSEGFNSDYLTGITNNVGGPPDIDNALWRASRSLYDAFNAAGAHLHTVDLRISDPMSPGEGGRTPQAAPVYAGGKPQSTQRFDPLANDTLFQFAAQTGGQFIHYTNDLPGALENLSTTTSTGYRLGFRPVNSKKGENTIEVKVKNVPSGTTVSFRKGFSTTPDVRNSSDALLLADIIENDLPQTGTPPMFSFMTRPFMDIIIPARQLARERGPIENATLMVYIFDGQGKAVEFREKKISIPKAPPSDMAIRQKLDMPPGNYVAKALLRIDKSIGFARIAFTIPVEK
jgi:VWFA-related protein